MNIEETNQVPSATAVMPATHEHQFGKRRSRDVLGLAWLNGAFHAAVFRRQQVTHSWESSESAGTLDEFSTALDQAIADTKFNGTEVFIVLAHDRFVHQVESTPLFSKSAVRTYLRNLVERYEKANEPVLWVDQPAIGNRDQGSHIVHMLPAEMYRGLNEILLARRLDLFRIVPVVLPLQLSLSTLTETEGLPVLVAAEVGDTTAVVVGRTGGQVLFARTILASWKDDAPRVAVEINRSLLYAKQQYGTAVDFVWLLGRETQEAQAEVSAKCGISTEVVTEAATPVDWLKSVAKLSVRHPVNLIAGYLRRKHQVLFVRRLAFAACWLAAVMAGFAIWENQQEWQQERVSLEELRGRGDEVLAEHERLARRNELTENNRAFIERVEIDRLPPVPSKFLKYFASVLPREGRLTEFVVKWDEQLNQWSFSIEGVLEADPQTAQSMLSALRQQLSESPVRAKFIDSSRRGSAILFNEERNLLRQNFKLEGGLFAN